MGSVIVSDFPAIFNEFRAKRFSVLWRDDRDSFGARNSTAAATATQTL
jgi:hypothetical protein